MYDKDDTKIGGKVTVEDTLQLLYVRHGRDKLDDEIRAIFGENEKTDDGSEKQIQYREYIEKINARAMEERKRRKKDMKEKWSKNHGQKLDEYEHHE